MILQYGPCRPGGSFEYIKKMSLSLQICLEVVYRCKKFTQLRAISACKRDLQKIGGPNHYFD